MIWSLLPSCWRHKQESSKELYVKVIVMGDALKPNAYNKGIGTLFYSYFNLSTDSLFYIYPQFSETDDSSPSYVNHAYQGMLNNPAFRDTLEQLIQSLEWRPSGIIDSIPEGAMYSGGEFYIEFPVKDKVKYYSVTYAVSDTLDRFFEFFLRLRHSPWDKVTADPKGVDIDREVVTALKRYGAYEELEVPYLFPECDSGINFSKLFGRWRTVGNNYHSTQKDRFMLYTLNPDRTFTIQKYRDGEFEDVVKGTYSVDVAAMKIFYTSSKGHKMTQTIAQLTDSCFSGTQTLQDTKSSKIKFNRY